MEIQEVLKHYMEDMKRVEGLIKSRMQSYVSLIPEISDYIIKGGGKRLRPLLLIISADLCGYKGDRCFPLASVMEFIHTASLLHDDVVDHALIRRGRPSANKIWGNSASVLVGDYLYASSFTMLSEDGDQSIQKLVSITTSAMAEGEILQLARCGDINTTEREYFAVVEKKTAILISAACAVGAILGNATEERVEALTKFGMRLGTAFQLTDDTLDYVAKEDDFGKTIGMDLKEGKITLPLIKALRKCTADERFNMERAMQDFTYDSIKEITSIIDKHEGIEYSLKKAVDLIDEGKSFLDVFEDSLSKKALISIADYVIERKS